MVMSSACDLPDGTSGTYHERTRRKEIVYRSELLSEEVKGRDRKVTKPMQHQQVIENFINKGIGGRGTYVKVGEDVLYSQLPSPYRPYGRYDWGSQGGRRTPLAVRLEDDESLLVNGARLNLNPA